MFGLSSIKGAGHECSGYHLSIVPAMNVRIIIYQLYWPSVLVPDDDVGLRGLHDEVRQRGAVNHDIGLRCRRWRNTHVILGLHN